MKMTREEIEAAANCFYYDKSRYILGLTRKDLIDFADKATAELRAEVERRLDYYCGHTSDVQCHLYNDQICKYHDLRQQLAELEEHNTIVHQQLIDVEKQLAEARAALDVLKTALNDGDGGSYWPARKYLDEHGIYHGDLNDLRVLYAVVKTARGE